MKKLSDTKLGQWLKDKAPGVLDLVGDVLPDKGVLGIVKNLIDRDDKMELHNKIEFIKLEQEFELEMAKLITADIASARDANVHIQESNKSSWLAKNVAYIIDLTLLYGTMCMITVIFYKAVPEENKELFYMAFGSILTFLGNSITFHRGTSRGSEEKQKLIDRIIRK